MLIFPRINSNLPETYACEGASGKKLIPLANTKEALFLTDAHYFLVDFKTAYIKF